MAGRAPGHRGKKDTLTASGLFGDLFRGLCFLFFCCFRRPLAQPGDLGLFLRDPRVQRIERRDAAGQALDLDRKSVV